MGAPFVLHGVREKSFFHMDSSYNSGEQQPKVVRKQLMANNANMMMGENWTITTPDNSST